MEIRKGDIVGRKSYGKDILFFVDRIIKIKNGKSYAILKGVNYRIEADSPLEDLEKISKEKIENQKRGIENKITKRFAKSTSTIFQNKGRGITNALILHLDGDRKYARKSERYYNKLGLKAVVRNIPEYKQPQVIRSINKKI